VLGDVDYDGETVRRFHIRSSVMTRSGMEKANTCINQFRAGRASKADLGWIDLSILEEQRRSAKG
jgi:hypothetical protein